MQERRDTIVKELKSEDEAANPQGTEVRRAIEQEIRSREIEKIESSPLVEITLEHGDDSVTSTNPDIFDELDRRTVTAVTFTGQFPSGYATEKLRVHLPWRNHFPPLNVHIVSSDHGWANKSLAMVTEEFDKRRTWWWRLHTPTGRGLLAGLAIVCLSLGTSTIIRGYAPGIPESRVPWITVSASLIFGILVCICTNNSRVYLALFPKVELSENEGFSRGGKSLSAVGGALVAIIIGVLVNKIS
jgi:hypothetical protein